MEVRRVGVYRVGSVTVAHQKWFWQSGSNPATRLKRGVSTRLQASLINFAMNKDVEKMKIRIKWQWFVFGFALGLTFAGVIIAIAINV